jgi:ATP-binding cassette subfamily B multidrug efflux pump
MLFRLFENLLEPTEKPPDASPPEIGSPHALMRFYWHFVRQIPRLLGALFVTGFVVALLDAAIPIFIGRIVTLVTSQAPADIWRVAGRQLLGMAGLLLVLRPIAHFASALVTNQVLIPGLTNLTRWQSHWHVVRQSWTYFQNDFAGRIANRVMQTGPALRESVVSSINAVWYILVYGTSAGLGACRLAAGAADPVLVHDLRDRAARFPAAHARAVAADVGDALGGHRPGRRQLHQYPHRQALCPGARRGRFRQGSGG